MSFTSLVFFLFLPLVFALHYLGRGRAWQNGVLLAASYVFYGWWDYRFCGLMLGASLLDYWTGRRIADSPHLKTRKLFLAISLIGNLGLLGFFKYFNFFADSLAVVLAAAGLDINTSTLSIILPVGISFYTFQTLSYTIDIYRGQFQPRRDLVEYLTFVSFFPQLVAGPIERATHLLPQFSRARSFSHSSAVEGSRLILWGLMKKMVLADNLGALADVAFAGAHQASAAQLVVGTVCFAFQIYGDFSGYSDIAVGVASLFGIQLQRNFAYPYFSQSLTEFWRRWHISLSTWFRDYVFIPLGGSRATSSRTAANVFATMVISGLWHGAAWHFVAWGAFHGVLLAGSRSCAKLLDSSLSSIGWRRGLGRGGPSLLVAPLLGPLPARASQGEEAARDTAVAGNRLHGSQRSETSAIPGGPGVVPAPAAVFRMMRTFALVCVGWIFFRAESFADALEICSKILVALAGAGFYGDLFRLAQDQWPLLGLLACFVTVEWIGRAAWNPLRIESWPQPARWALYTAISWGLLLLGTQRSLDFIYFQF